MDVLSDVLRALRLRSTVYFEADFRAPWGMDMRAGQFAQFHLVTRGCCWLRMGNRDARELKTGDLVVLPHGDAHSLSHARDARTVPAQDLLGEPDSKTPTFGGEGEATRMVCGHFECDRDGPHPLLDALPHLLYLDGRAEETQSDWLGTLMKLAADESRAAGLGSSVIVDRLAEVFFIQVLCAHARRLPWKTGFLAALADPGLSAALSSVHEEPAAPWNVAGMAERASMSRAAFSARFMSLVGVGPMQYVTQWRMQRARLLLCESDRSTAQVAESVGYRDEWGFAKAFKRTFGIGPGAARRATR